MNNKRKGQSLTEYLIGYSWIILALAVVAGVMWNMGLFGGAEEAEEPMLYESIEHYEYALCIDRCIGDDLYLGSPNNCYKYHCQHKYYLWKLEEHCKINICYSTVEFNMSDINKNSTSIISEATLYIIAINDTDVA